MADDDFEALLKETGATPGASEDDFEALQAELGLVEPSQEPQSPKPPAGSSEPSWLDILLAGADGASLGHGKLGQRIGNAVADMAGYARPQGTRVVGGGVMEQVPDTTSTRLARGAGTLATAIPASIAGGATVGGQAAAGALLGAGQAHGNSGGDWLDTLQGGLTGGAVGALGGALAKGARGVSSALNAPARPELIGGATRGGEALAELAAARPSLAQTFMSPWGAAKNAVGQATVRGAMNADKLAPVARYAGQASAAFGGGMGTSKAHAQDSNGPAMTWAIESVLSSGAAQLPPEDEHRLTAAVLSGDPERVTATNFQLQQKYPAYAKRMREQLESLSQEE